MFMTASSNGISHFFLTHFTFFCLCSFVYHIYTLFSFHDTRGRRFGSFFLFLL